MIKLPMIIAIIVSVISAQGVIAQEDLAYANTDNEFDYQNEFQEYVEVKIVDLPMAVQNAVVNDYGASRIVKAYIAKDNSYKLILINENNQSKILFINADGEWISSEDKS
ncbi:hypothetical protein NBT05_03765 [Aquimarina sp. ERC-38]|uniref:hypothetical protein n=1 Tax=Aquimarina sp. ERC-38 TaxID=2949996 RepID=UPI00224755C8|nr:hypothetical protein [Aquimarina sp. ERC-38]UZO81598.1 hypothetical protein NBT05_03765 [Aquimarina sp. ERC-38]